MTGKERYENIEIPSRLSGVIHEATQRGRIHKRKMRWLRGSSTLVAACAALMITVNVPSVAMALSDIPVISSIVKVLQVGSGGERTDGVSVTTTVQENMLNIHFSIDGEQISNAPAYTVDHKEAPNRLIFTFNGVRNLDFEKLKQDIGGLSNVKDVYSNVILDDSAVRFVVELKDNIDYSVSEYQKPGFIQLKLFGAAEKEKQHEVFYVRSQEMELGEMLGMLDEQYAEDGSNVIKTKNGKYVVAMGGFASRSDAEDLLRELSAREDYSEPLHVDSWMSNDHPQ
ncbi:SPOR domain-containing protein [Paenibacillus dokdonensis]|uniref:SPOR domain-containing protein n=1 Tax=Paenibacillus dokdonensis TaxID=2567944 RepID=A0ABU6GN69_9BACL|nr:SPOR domain-containing protein [Paenibacillus dokdonensis]MEC0241202.1 SPOR domain-containing protein [Paenibacillus dokdonensis]